MLFRHCPRIAWGIIHSGTILCKGDDQHFNSMSSWKGRLCYIFLVCIKRLQRNVHTSHIPLVEQAFQWPVSTSGSKKTSDPRMMSCGGNDKVSFDMWPHVSPTICTCGRLFIWQLCQQISRQWGSSGLSDSVTLAPHLAAKIPGRLTPAPISKTALPGRTLLWNHRYWARTTAQGQTYIPYWTCRTWNKS